LRLLFIFIDGVGLGLEQPDNPFHTIKTSGISAILEGKSLTASAAGFCGEQASLCSLDATLGIPGLPQSATGQAAIFTGLNAPEYLGGHLNGFPDYKLRKLLATKGLFRQLKSDHYKVVFANAYRPPFFDLLRRGLLGNHYSCSTLVTYYGGLPFFSLKDLEAGHALFMDITNDILQKMGFEVPLITPEQGAERLLEISKGYDFTMFEYFLSDLAGHMADQAEAKKVILILDRFIGTLAAKMNFDDTMLVIASDHGNLENLSGRVHTLNEVPALLVGSRELRLQIQHQLHDLTDLLPAFKKMLAWKGIN
jgi:2,3-bisphosphoglycerate-independent phosphoglycerate mutase